MGEELLGLLKLKVERGVNLAIRDVIRRSSDPYVILHLGNHKVKTHVIKQNKNPEWNEELTLSVQDPSAPLKLQVFDKDLFSWDDPLGHAEIDLRPLIDIVKQDSSLPDGTIITTVTPSRENCFAEESKIYWSQGKVMQDMALRLQDVERGKIELKLTWNPVKGA